jgi:hypothetical protein
VLSPAGGLIDAELYRIERPGILKALDGFELYRPAQPQPYDRRTGKGSLFVRRTVLAGGVRAFIYLWNGDIRNGRRISAY